VVRSVEGVNGAQLLRFPEPGSGPLHQTLIIVELTGKGTFADVARAVEDAQTVHRAEILPGVATVVTGKLKPDTEPEAITEALKKAGLFDEPAPTAEQEQDSGG
jgi:hypothetical protein